MPEAPKRWTLTTIMCNLREPGWTVWLHCDGEAKKVRFEKYPAQKWYSEAQIERCRLKSW